MKISLTLIIIAIFFGVTDLCAQSNDIRYEVEAQAIGTTNGVVPFWMRSNQYGSVPLAGVSGSLIGRAYKDYEEGGPYTLDSKLVDWAAGFQGRVNLGNGSNLQLIEAYGKLRVGMFQLQAGRTRDVMGLNGDTTLSSGNFAVSGNALGIPKVEISIPEYWTIPWFDGLFAVKGNFAHGWVGKVPVNKLLGGEEGRYIYSNIDKANTYFHQKSFYGRLGKPDWKIKLLGGFNHQVYWGDEQPMYGKDKFMLSPFETFYYVIVGKAYGGNGVERSKIGNHLGSIDLGVAYDIGDISILGYRQNFYDVGALAKLANIRDGLNGISIGNKLFDEHERKIKWKSILFEFLYTRNQAGERWSKPTKSGDENYYNNYMRLNGWSYKGLGLGTPFITQASSARAGQAHIPHQFFINNRVIAFHLGVEGGCRGWKLLAKTAYSINYGTFGTSETGHSTGNVYYEPAYGIFTQVRQFSALLGGDKTFDKGLSFGCLLSVDAGNLLNNSIGGILKLSKAF